MNRYQDITILNTDTGKPYYKTTLYPQVPLSVNDIYVITGDGDRFDILAQQYYNDASLWWIISIANTELKQNSYYLPLGIQIRIPYNVAAILAEYNKLNNRTGRL